MWPPVTTVCRNNAPAISSRKKGKDTPPKKEKIKFPFRSGGV